MSIEWPEAWARDEGWPKQNGSRPLVTEELRGWLSLARQLKAHGTRLVDRVHALGGPARRTRVYEKRTLSAIVRRVREHVGTTRDRPTPGVSAAFENDDGWLRRHGLGGLTKLCDDLGIPRHKTPIPHGTRTGYDYHNCRCPECRATHAARMRAKFARRRAAGFISEQVEA